ncbi:MAG TPA: hypothetical protein DER23_00140, partial [Clostridiales bacterium]|nr:hypothetical protein [Clostridiales bacterium]
MKTFFRNYLSLLLLLALLISTLPFRVSAESDDYSLCLNEGNVLISQGSGANTMDIQHGTALYQGIPASAKVYIYGTGNYTSNVIRITGDIAVNLTISGVRISSSKLRAPIEIRDLATLNLTVTGDNVLIAPDYMAALQVNKKTTLNLTGSGSLYVQGGTEAAGIGGGWTMDAVSADAGTIRLGGSGKLYAYGGNYGAGIGGGNYGVPKNVIIESSVLVLATGGTDSAGIGGGANANSGSILIQGKSHVEAIGGFNGGAGIGSGHAGTATSIKIIGEALVRAQASAGGAAIGCGSIGSVRTIILGGSAVISAQSSTSAAAIGGGNNANVAALTIKESAKVYAIGGSSSAGIGTGPNGQISTLLIQGSAQIRAFGGINGSGIGCGEKGTLVSIVISDHANVQASGGYNGAGIGSGYMAKVSAITVKDNAQILAFGGKHAAGIGGGSKANTTQFTFQDNANVVAHGGNFGPGIGNGARSTKDEAISSTVIVISDKSKLTAYGGSLAAGVGGGTNAAGASVTMKDSCSVTSIPNNKVAQILKDLTVITLGEQTAQQQTPQPKEGENPPQSYPADVKSPTLKASLISASATAKAGIQSSTKFAGANLSMSEFISSETKLFLIATLYPHYEKEIIDTSTSDTYSEGGHKASSVGAGAGCFIEGSLIMQGSSSLNEKRGELTVTLDYCADTMENQTYSVASNEKFTLTTPPTRLGYAFEGWYDSADYKHAVSGTVKITDNRTFYAKWAKLSDSLENMQPPLPDATQKKHYTFALYDNELKNTYYTITAGMLPTGLELDSRTGVISGIPTAAGEYLFAITIEHMNEKGDMVSEEDPAIYSLSVYSENTYLFSITTGSIKGAHTASKVYVSFYYVDRFTNLQYISEEVNLTEQLSHSYSSPLKAGETQFFEYTFPAEVGEPMEIYLRLEGKD